MLPTAAHSPHLIHRGPGRTAAAMAAVPWRRRFGVLAAAAAVVFSSATSRADASARIPTVWTGGPTRIVFARATGVGSTVTHWFAYEEFGTSGIWKDTTARPVREEDHGDFASAVTTTPSPSVWETRLFYVKSGSAGRQVIGCVRRDSAGNWASETIPSIPLGASVARGPAAVSNVYNAVNTLVARGTGAQIAVYFVGIDGKLWTTWRTSAGWASSWQNLSNIDFGLPGPGFDIGESNLEATASFDNNAFRTSVWALTAGGGLARNEGPFNGGWAERKWIGSSSGHLSSEPPAAVTWYDSGHVGEASFGYTRVVATALWGSEPLATAYAFNAGGNTGFDELSRPTTALLSAGAALQDCGGCPNPPTVYRVVANSTFDTQDIAYLDKGSSLTGADTWTTLPRAPHPVMDLVRLPFNTGLGQIFALSGTAPTVMEFMPASNRWVNRLLPFLSPMTAEVGGDNSSLQGIRLYSDGTPYVEAWQADSNGAWSDGGLLPTPSASTKFSSLATGRAANGRLYVFGTGATNNLAYIVASQETNGAWTAGVALPGQSTPYSALGAVTNSRLLYLVGLGKNDGRAYVAAKQDMSGNWVAGAGQFPGQTATLTSMTVIWGGNSLLHVIGLGTDRKPYLAGSLTSTGTMVAGRLLANATFSALAVAPGNNGFLQVIGLGYNGSISVVAWQDSAGTWNSGGALTAPVPLSQIAAARDHRGNLQVMGIGANDAKVYLAAFQDGSTWRPGSVISNTLTPLADLTLGRSLLGGLHVMGNDTDGLHMSSVAKQGPDGTWLVGDGPLP